MLTRLQTDSSISSPGSNGLVRLQRLQLLSLIPLVVAMLLNSGYQYYRALPLLDGFEASGLRDRLARLLGASAEEPGLYDFLATGFAHLAPVLLMALITGGIWERVIADKRGRPFETGFVVIAVLFTLLLPGSAPFAHVVLGMSFAILVGKGIFGGDGKTFVSPALLGIAFVQVSFPAAASLHPLWQGLAGYSGSDVIALFDRGGEAALNAAGITPWTAFIGIIPGPGGTTSVLAVVLGAAVLMAKRVIAWRLLLAQVIGVMVMALLFNLTGSQSGASALSPGWHLLLGGFAFGAVYLACDPFASACTNPGRWIQGILIGALIVLIRVINPTHPDAVIPVLLLASISAPLIDHAVIAMNIRHRARRDV